MSRSNLRALVRGAYDVQKIRIQMGNRIAANWRAKLGMEPGEKLEDGLDSKAKALIRTLRSSYDRLTDGLVTLPRATTFKGDELISNMTELVMIDQYIELENSERRHFRQVGTVLNDFPIYTVFLEGVRGIGPAMAGVLISEYDISLATYPSSMWKYAGLDVAGDGRARSRREEHRVDVQYTAKDGTTKTRSSLTYNPFLKTKLLGVLAPSFLRAGERDNPYEHAYRSYKHRIENHPAHEEKTLAHRHRMALRYMVKIFLVDLYRVWRALEGHTVAPDYAEAKLGMTHRKSA